MKNEAKSRQIALLLLLIIPGGKYLSMPSVFAAEAGKDSWIAIALLLLFDLICFTFLLWAIKLNKQNISFYDILSKTITKVGAKIVMVLFFMFFAARILMLCTSAYDLFTLTFSVKMTWPVFVLLIGALVLFLTARGFKTIVRLNELLFGFVLVGLLLILITPASHIETDNLLPFFEDGFSPVMRTILSGNFWFADYVFIYFIFDKIKCKQNIFAPNLICFIIGAGLTVFMNILFISLYGEMAKETHLAISRVSQYALASSVKGRLDWLSMSLWSATVFLKLAAFVFSAYRCLEHLFEIKSGGFRIWLGLTVLSVLVLPLFFAADDILKFILLYLSIPFAVVQYLIPLLLPLLVFWAEKKATDSGNQLRKTKSILGKRRGEKI